MELLADLEAAFKACGKWARGTECRQSANGQTRYFNLSDLVTILQWLEAPEPLTAEQERIARRAIALTKWHKPAREGRKD